MLILKTFAPEAHIAFVISRPEPGIGPDLSSFFLM